MAWNHVFGNFSRRHWGFIAHLFASMLAKLKRALMMWDLKAMCQQFWDEFHWYVFPSEMERRITHIQSQRAPVRRKKTKKKFSYPRMLPHFAR